MRRKDRTENRDKEAPYTIPFWESPPPIAGRTRRDILEDMEFQRQFKLRKAGNPVLVAAAEERIAELQRELHEMEHGVTA